MGNKLTSEQKRKRDTTRHAAVTSATTAIRQCNPRDRTLVQDITLTQMERGGQPFTKADWIALLYHLSDRTADTARLALMTVDDLRLAVRLRLYAPPGTAIPVGSALELLPGPSPQIEDAKPEPSAPPKYAPV